MRRLLLVALLATLSAGCGSQADVRPPATPAPSPPVAERPPGELRSHVAPSPRPVRRAIVERGAAIVELDPAARELLLRDASSGAVRAREPAGAGPAQLATDGMELIWVTDTQLDAVLIFHTRPRLELTRRVRVGGDPWALVHDEERRRLWVTQPGRNSILAMDAGGRPGRRGVLPTVRDPRAVRLDPAGRLVVRGARRTQVVDPDRVELAPIPRFDGR